MPTLRVLVKIISIPGEELFSETSVALLHTLSKLYDVPVGFVTPPPYSFEAVYCFISGRRRVAVARYRMICLVLIFSIVDNFIYKHVFRFLVHCYLFTDSRGRTALHIAINQGDLDTVRVLISSNCNLYHRANVVLSLPNQPSREVNVDPFELAVTLRSWEIVNLLILAGYNLASIDYLSNFSISPPTYFDDVPWFLDYLKELAITPMSLFRQTCLIIRRILRTCVQDKVETLPLPVSLKQSISLCNYADYGVIFE